ncbi:DUF890 domain protein [Fusarium austroafricanum]|uniref:DUF890 domain protein n=1 Tax=Fusarium austroafricanum TaxID=2364996 RepID=A0A8H4NWC4_9HYPO|nr:DUF890 domain protein [Fusarium austroafricanum]
MPGITQLVQVDVMARCVRRILLLLFIGHVMANVFMSPPEEITYQVTSKVEILGAEPIMADTTFDFCHQVSISLQPFPIPHGCHEIMDVATVEYWQTMAVHPLKLQDITNLSMIQSLRDDIQKATKSHYRRLKDIALYLDHREKLNGFKDGFYKASAEAHDIWNDYAQRQKEILVRFDQFIRSFPALPISSTPTCPFLARSGFQKYHRINVVKKYRVQLQALLLDSQRNNQNLAKRIGQKGYHSIIDKLSSHNVWLVEIGLESSIGSQCKGGDALPALCELYKNMKSWLRATGQQSIFSTTSETPQRRVVTDYLLQHLSSMPPLTQRQLHPELDSGLDSSEQDLVPAHSPSDPESKGIPYLPAELRLMVWELSPPDPCIHVLVPRKPDDWYLTVKSRPLPTIPHLCKESRAYGLQFLKTFPPSTRLDEIWRHRTRGRPAGYFNPKTDLLHLRQWDPRYRLEETMFDRLSVECDIAQSGLYEIQNPNVSSFPGTVFHIIADEIDPLSEATSHMGSGFRSILPVVLDEFEPTEIGVPICMPHCMRTQINSALDSHRVEVVEME